MAKSPQTRGSGDDTVPGALPDTPTPKYAQPGHDFTLQAVMEMHKSIGELTAKTDRLIADVDGQSAKIDGLRHQATFIKGGLAVGIFLIGAFITIASFFLSAKWDAVMQAIRATAKP
jgi:hypothetical protein